MSGRRQSGGRSGRPQPAINSRDRDEQLLMLMHLREDLDWSFTRCGDALGMTKNAAIGAYRRIMQEAVYSCSCQKPENRDVIMNTLRLRKPLD